MVNISGKLLEKFYLKPFVCYYPGGRKLSITHWFNLLLDDDDSFNLLFKLWLAQTLSRLNNSNIFHLIYAVFGNPHYSNTKKLRIFPNNNLEFATHLFRPSLNHVGY